MNIFHWSLAFQMSNNVFPYMYILSQCKALTNEIHPLLKIQTQKLLISSPMC